MRRTCSNFSLVSLDHINPQFLKSIKVLKHRLDTLKKRIFNPVFRKDMRKDMSLYLGLNLGPKLILDFLHPPGIISKFILGLDEHLPFKPSKYPRARAYHVKNMRKINRPLPFFSFLLCKQVGGRLVNFVWKDY